LEEQYRCFLSGFHDWEALDHAEKYLIFPENIGSHLSIDETALSYDELYTIVTNKAAKGRKGALVAIIKGTAAETVIKYLKEINISLRRKVKEVTLDMAPNMELIAETCFPKASLVTDRFHVQRLAVEALQEMRIAYRWEAIDRENDEMELAKEMNKKHKPEVLDNGDTHKQLLARSRYLLFKGENKWTTRQRFRAEILFRYYPSLESAYKLTMELKSIYEHTKDKAIALTKLARWYEKIEQT
jgi:Transposase and inactivated derivatives